MLTSEDLKSIEKRGISKEMIEAQLQRFESGFPFLKINSVATVGNGIVKLSAEDLAKSLTAWKEFQNGNFNNNFPVV